MSRGLRNRNPGNIRCSATRYKGEIFPSGDAEFKQFESLEWGYRAMFVLLHSYRLRHSLNTIRQMIGRYAPTSENDTGAYVAAVEHTSSIDADRPLDTLSSGDMVPVVCAMSRVENGVDASKESVIKGWKLFRADR